MADAPADLEAHPHQQGGAMQTAKDLFSGAAGGVAQVLLGKSYPLVGTQVSEERLASVSACGWTSLSETW